MKSGQGTDKTRLASDKVKLLVPAASALAAPILVRPPPGHTTTSVHIQREMNLTFGPWCLDGHRSPSGFFCAIRLQLC